MQRELPTNPSKARKNSRDQKPRPFARKGPAPQERLRSSETAWKMVMDAEEKEGLCHKGVRRWHLDKFIPSEDALQLARISAVESAMKWDPSEKTSFSKYALDNMRSCWREVYPYIETVHIPYYMREALEFMNKWLESNPGKTREDFFASNDFIFLAESKKCTPASIEDGIRRMKRAHFPLHGETAFNSFSSSDEGERWEAKTIMREMDKGDSGFNNGTELLPPEQAVFHNALSSALKSALRKLDIKKSNRVPMGKVISMRFGMNGYKRMRELREIAERFGFTKQRAHTVVKTALEMLEKDPRLRRINMEL
ncbi:hypothetical protein GF415_03495 [Candidatus Micrarchaeota archaeon]|nr:hypothetical protein [Candidatus Micrarchaeota archaeon]